MSLFVFGPILYPDCFRLIYTVSRSVKKIFLFYTVYRSKSKSKAYLACKEAWNEIEACLENLVITYDIAVIKIWFDENEIFPSKGNDVESEFDFPVLKLWDSPRKLSGCDCSSFSIVKTYMNECGLEFQTKKEKKEKCKRKLTEKRESTTSVNSYQPEKAVHYRFPSYDSSVRSDSTSSFASLQKFLISSDYSIDVTD